MIKEKKAVFHESRLKAINAVHTKSRETVPSSPAVSHGTEASVRPIVPLLQFSRTQEQSSLTLAHIRYQRECRSQRTSVSPHHTSLSPCESPEDPQEGTKRKSTWNHFLTYHKESKRHSSNSTPSRVVNIHTEQLRKAKESVRAAHFFSVQRAEREVRVKTMVRKSPHHLFRIASHSGCFTLR